MCIFRTFSTTLLVGVVIIISGDILFPGSQHCVCVSLREQWSHIASWLTAPCVHQYLNSRPTVFFCCFKQYMQLWTGPCIVLTVVLCCHYVVLTVLLCCCNVVAV